MSLPLYKTKETDYNFLPNNGYKIQFNRLPLVEFYAQAFQVPGMSIGEVIVEHRANSIPYAGEKIKYDLLTMNFMVDEKMKNYKELYKWIKELSVEEPEDPVAAKAAGVKNKCDTRGHTHIPLRSYSITNNFSDASDSSAELFVLDSNFKTVSTFVFKDIFPLGITALGFTSQGSDIQYIQCTADFAYTKYYIKEIGI